MLSLKYKVRFYISFTLLIGILWILCFFSSNRIQSELEEQKNLTIQRYEDYIWKQFLNPYRDKKMQPARVIKFLGLKNGDVVADIGAGSGYFIFRLAKAVGPQGVAYAVDVQPEGLAYIQRRITDTNANPYNNIYCIVNKLNDVCLLDESLDLAFLCDVHFYRFARLSKMNEDMIRSIYKAVKPGGRLAVIEKKKRHSHTTSESIIRENFEKDGFKLIKSYKFINTHFFLLLQKK